MVTSRLYIYPFSFVFAVFLLLYSMSNAQEKNSLSQVSGLYPIAVTIGGDFLVTGSFPAFTSERVDQFITRIAVEAKQNLTAVKTSDKLLLEETETEIDIPLRNITLKRADGSVLKIDLLSFHRTGDLAQNPYLKNDDVLIFPPYSREGHSIYISGFVNKPGYYQFVSGDDLQTALYLAMGLNETYGKAEYAEIYRANAVGNVSEIIKVAINEKTPLRAGDRIRIGDTEIGEHYFTAYLGGEVQMEGEISITRNSTTLADILTRVTPTDRADLRRVRIVKKDLFPPLALLREYGIKDKKEYAEVLQQSSFFSADADWFKTYRLSNMDEQDTVFYSYVVRNAAISPGIEINLLSDPELAKQIILRDGDMVIIPAKDIYVHVQGYVRSSGLVLFQPGKDYRYYIEKSGGLGELAIEDEIMVIKGLSREWVKPEEAGALEAGDIIYIPRETQRSTRWYVFEVSTYLGIVGNIATIILLLTQFGK